jgi:hypothetical protein
MEELLANCEECGKQISADYRVCADCDAKLEAREWDEFNQDRANRFDD